MAATELDANSLTEEINTTLYASYLSGGVSYELWKGWDSLAGMSKQRFSESLFKRLEEYIDKAYDEGWANGFGEASGD